MPMAYECWKCKKIFKYTKVEVRILKDKNSVVVAIPCKQPTYGSLGSTGDDYVCGECIEKAVVEKGTS